MKQLTSIVFFLLFLANYCLADILVYKENYELLKLKDHSSYLQDKTGLTIQQILKSDPLFTKNNKDILNFNTTSSAVWIKFEFKNNNAKNCYLIISNPTLDSVSLFYKNEKGTYSEKTIGYSLATSKREISSPDIIFELPGKQDEAGVYYIKIKSREVMYLPIYIGDNKSISGYTLTNTILDSMYFGIVLVMIFYNLFLYFSLKDRSYLYYVSFIFLFGFFMLFWKGYSIFFPETIKILIGDYANSIVALTAVASILFISYFLELKKYSLWLYKTLRICLYLFVLTIPLEVLGYKMLSSDYSQLLLLPSSIILLFSFILAYRKGSIYAKYYMIGYCVYMITQILYLMMTFTILPYPSLGSHIITAGSAFEIAMISLSLGMKINILKTEKEKLLITSLKIEQSYNEELAHREEELSSNEEEMRQINDQLKQNLEILETNEKKQKRFRSILERSNDAIFIYDISLKRFIDVNEAACISLGYDRKDLLTMGVADISKNQDANLPNLTTQLINLDSTKIIESEHIRRDGSTFPVEISLAFEKHEGGGNIIAIARDISERKEKENLLKLNEEKFRLVSKASNDAIWDWNLIENQIEWSEGLKNIYGFKNANAYTTFTIDDWEKSLHIEDKERVIKFLYHCINGTENEWEDEYRIYKENGDIVHIIDRSVIQRDSSGKAYRMIGGMHDITESKLHEFEILKILEREQILNEELATREEKLNKQNFLIDAIINSIPFDLWARDTEQKIILQNTTSKKYWGEKTGTTPSGEYTAHWAKNNAEALSGLVVNGEIEYTIDNKINFYNEIIAPIKDQDDEVIGIVGININITALKEKEKELIQSLEKEQTLNEELAQREEELTSKEEELRQSLEELSATNDELTETYKIISDKERQVSAIFDNTSDIIVSVDKNLNITAANKSFKEVYKLVVKEDFNLNTSIFKIIPKDRTTFYTNIYNKALQGEFQFYITENNGDIFGRYISEEFYSPILDEKGSVEGFAIFIRDITKRIDAEEKVKRNELLYSTIINSTNDFILSLDENLKLLAYNDSYKQRILKIFKIDIIPGETSAYDVMPEVLKEEYVNLFNRVLKGEFITRTFTRSYPGREIPELVTEETFNPIINEKNEVKGIAVFSRDITDKVNAERTIKENEIKFSAVINSTTDFIISLNKNLIINAANHSYVSRIGKLYNVEIKPGITNALEVIPEYLHEQYNAIFEKVLKGECITEYFKRTYTHIDSNNTLVFYSEEFFNPIYNEHNKVSGIAIFARDITAKRIAEDKLKESEKMLLKAQSIAKLGSWSYNTKTHDIIWSDETYLIFDISKDTAINMELYSKLLDPSVFKENLNKISRTIETREPFTIQYKYTHPSSGISKYLIGMGSPIINDDEVIEIQGSIQDITERKLYEQIIQESENFLDSIIENIPLGIMVLDEKGKEIRYNKAQRDLAGITENYTKSDSINDGELITENEIHKLFERGYKGEIIINEEVHVDFSTPAHKYSNRTDHAWFLITVFPIMENNIIKAVVSVTNDITKDKVNQNRIKEGTDKLIESNKMIAEYKLMALRSVMNPHFLFNSLNSIQYFIAKNDKEQALNYLSLFSKLIRSILNSSINNSNTIAEEIDILKIYVNLERLRFDNKFDIVFNIDENIDIHNIEIPSLLIQPYVENAILHGLYNKEEKGTLKISISEINEDTLLFEVEDNGIGRKAALEIKNRTLGSHKSVGMILTKERLEIINQENDVNVEIIDLMDKKKPIGTLVKVYVKLSA